MHAKAGDRMVIRNRLLGHPVRDGEIIEVRHADGTPPYVVRWSDTGHESLFFPGPDAYVDHLVSDHEGSDVRSEVDVHR